MLGFNNFITWKHLNLKIKMKNTGMGMIIYKWELLKAVQANLV